MKDNPICPYCGDYVRFLDPAEEINDDVWHRTCVHYELLRRANTLANDVDKHANKGSDSSVGVPEVHGV